MYVIFRRSWSPIDRESTGCCDLNEEVKASSPSSKSARTQESYQRLGVAGLAWRPEKWKKSIRLPDNRSDWSLEQNDEGKCLECFLGGSMCCAKLPFWEIGIARGWCLSLVGPFVLRSRMWTFSMDGVDVKHEKRLLFSPGRKPAVFLVCPY